MKGDTAFNCKSQCAKEYVAPPDEVLCEGFEHTLQEKLAGIIQEMKTTEETKSLSVIEQDFLNSLTPMDARERPLNNKLHW